MADFNTQVIEEFRTNGGKVGGMFEGAPILLLTTTGAKSGNTEHRLPVVAAGHGEHRQRHRQLLDRVQPARPPRPQPLVAVVLADGVVRRHRRTQPWQRVRPTLLRARHVEHRLDGRLRTVVGHLDGDLLYAGHGGAGGQRRRHRAGEHACRLPAVAGLVRTGELDRLGVRPFRVGGVHHPHGRHVHRRTTVDDVADPCLARVVVPVVQAQHEPFLGEEDPLQRQGFRLELGYPHLVVDQPRHKLLRDVVRVQVVAALTVDAGQRQHHQRVVDDMPVALVVRRDRPGVAPVRVEWWHDPGDPAAVPRDDLLGCPALCGIAERIADCSAGDAPDGLVP